MVSQLSTREDIDEDSFKLYNADSRTLSDTLSNHFPEHVREDGLFDTIITSPPYGDVKDYGYDEDIQVGMGDSYQEYLESLRDIFGQTYDLTKDTGTMWVVVNTFRKNHHLYELPSDVADVCENLTGTPTCDTCAQNELTIPLTLVSGTDTWKCQNCGTETTNDTTGWNLQDIVIWDKGRALPYSQKGKLRNVFEYILFFTKTDEYKFDTDSIRIPDPEEFKEWWVNFPERYHPRGKLPDNIWKMITPSQGSWGNGSIDHPAPFPPELIEKTLRLTTDEGDVVFDPFAGSGTVLAQADAMNRRSLGFEYSTEYCERYSAVREDIHSEWTGSKTESLETRQQKLEQLIASLRLTRQARELLRLTAKEHPDYDTPADLPVATMFAICNEIQDSRTTTSFLDVSYLVATTEPPANTDIHTQLSNRLEQNPLNSYGITPSVTTLQLEDLQANVQNDNYPWTTQQLFVYTEGTHNIYDQKTTASDWATTPQNTLKTEYTTNDYPPIISNRGLDVPRPSRQGDSVVFDTDAVHVEYGTTLDPTSVTVPTPNSAD